MTTPATRLRVRVTPRAASSGIVGMRDGVLAVRLHSPPVDDAANEELIRLLARELRVPRTAIQIVAGHRSRNKTLAISSEVVNIASLEKLGLADKGDIG